MTKSLPPEPQVKILREIMDKRRGALAALAAYDRGDWKPGDPLPQGLDKSR